MKNLLVILLFLASMVSSQAKVISPKYINSDPQEISTTQTRSFKGEKGKHRFYKKQNRSHKRMAMTNGQYTDKVRKMRNKSCKKNQKMNKRHHRARVNRGFNRN